MAERVTALTYQIDRVGQKLRCAVLVTGVGERWEHIVLDMGRDATKPVFGVSDKARFKPISSLQRLARN